MFDVGGGELILIIFAVLLLFGPKKIPEIMQMFGKGVNQMKKAQAQFQTQINEISKEVSSPIESIHTSMKENIKTMTNTITESAKEAEPVSEDIEKPEVVIPKDNIVPLKNRDALIEELSQIPDKKDDLDEKEKV